jgi:hypothetical protein
MQDIDRREVEAERSHQEAAVAQLVLNELADTCKVIGNGRT